MSKGSAGKLKNSFVINKQLKSLIQLDPTGNFLKELLQVSNTSLQKSFSQIRDTSKYYVTTDALHLAFHRIRGTLLQVGAEETAKLASKEFSSTDQIVNTINDIENSWNEYFEMAKDVF